MFGKSLIALVLVGLTGINAIQITSPSNSTGWVSSGAQEIIWTSVSTDAANFTLQLITPSSPNSPITIATVQTSAGSYTYTPASDLAVGTQYRVNAESTSGNSAILAQSEYFAVTSGTSTVSASSSSASSSGTSSSSASASSISGSVSGSTTASATNSATSAASTSAKSGAGVQYSLSYGAGVMVLLAGGMGVLA